MSVGTENVSKPKSKRIFYFDALRALAIICVLVYHVFTKTNGLVMGEYPHFTFSWFMADVMGNCFRIGVDLFLMLSGALSLGRVWDIRSFLGKRIPRIVEPFVFWVLILSVLMVVCSYYSPIIDIVKTFDFATISNYIVGAFFANSLGFAPNWFFWMILGTYLIMPVLNKWLLHSDLKEAEYFLVFWLITCIFDFTLMQKFPVKLSYFSGPIGLVVLGYYLRHTKRKVFDNLYVPIIFMILGAAGAVVFSYFLSSNTEIFDFERYSLFLILEVIGVFLLFRNLSNVNLNINFFKNPNGIFRKSIFSLAKYSYGIYLIHCPILNIIVILLKKCTTLGFKPIVLISFIVMLLVSWAIMALLNRVPYVNKVIGAK